MTTATTSPSAATATDRFAALYEGARAALAGSARDGEMARRDAAMARFREMGVPRRGDEEWKYTNLAGLDALPFELAGAARVVAPEAVEPALVGAGPRIVLVNGRFDERLSDATEAPAGVTVEAHVPADASVLDRCTDLAPLPFARLCEALAPTAAVVRVAPGVEAAEPIQAVFITTAGDAPVAAFPRLRVEAGAGASVTVVETHLVMGAGATVAASLTEIDAADGARVVHECTADLNESSWRLAAIVIRQARSSRVESAAVATGGGVTRHDFRASLDGPGADCALRGLAMLSRDEHVDNHLLVRHAAPECTSREFFKNVLDGSSRGVFCGRIHVDQDAQKTDGVQTNATILLSDDAEAQSRPQLEIYADDVKCTHGATVGQLDEGAVFYLRSRGLPEARARALLIDGFAGEILDAYTVAAVRDRLKSALFGPIPGGAGAA
ncbi:MAG: Fe-S cluster assembly protein SufD [Planctomycetota bacterium]|nr:MAG: Fe-S cluster assembly protein SufD [Planctomycetota bacterium]